jgi:hypothetical protein
MARRHCLVPLILCTVAVAAGKARAQQPKSAHLEGVAATGLNRRLGQPLRNYGAGYVGTFGFESVGVYDPNGRRALPLTAATPGSALLATVVDPLFVSRGIDESKLSDQLNVPLRDVGVIVDPAGKSRRALPDILDPGVAQLKVSRAHSNGPITLQSWLAARGNGIVQCEAGERPTVKLFMDGLIPNGLYSVWAVYRMNKFPLPGPLGGVTNAFVADDEGRATFERVLNYCPLDLKPGETPVLQFDVLYHSDARLFGARQDLPGQNLIMGTVSHIQLEFPLTGMADTIAAR